MGKSLTPSSTFPLAEIPGCTQNFIATVCNTVMSAGKLETLKTFPVMTWKFYSLQSIHKILWCPSLEGWECNKHCNCSWTVILVPQEVNKWVFSLPGFQHQQNLPDRCGNTSLCYCYCFPRDQGHHHSPLPWGSCNKLMQCLIGKNSLRRNCKPTKQWKSLKEVEAIKIQCSNRMLISWLQIKSTIHLIWWLICSKLRHHSQHGLLALQEAPHSCVFHGAMDPGNCSFMTWKEYRGRFLLQGAWPFHRVLLCQDSSCRGMWWWRPRCTHGRGHMVWCRLGRCIPVLKLGVLFADGKMLVYALVFFLWSIVTSNGTAPDCTTSGES